MVYSTQVAVHVKALPAAVYRALIDPDAIARWRVPDGMSTEVHEFEAREGGRFRISLSYSDPATPGKSGEHSDTYHGHFAELVRNERVVEVLEFESDDPALRGTMTMTTTLAEAAGGTDVVLRQEGVPDVVPPADNETGFRMALDKLARLVESPQPSP
ncbi:MAG TPA: SRPBCC family protein [Frankiaceae bacterium]|jgi:uncharacterized protein YndB with AHSA1/START domain|nr:SRPBCC family protein [Frankiaceae bacterium]